MHRICVLLSVWRMGSSPSLHHPHVGDWAEVHSNWERKGTASSPHWALLCYSWGKYGGVVYAGFAKWVSLVGMAPLDFSNKSPSSSPALKWCVHSYQLSRATQTVQGMNESTKNRRILPHGLCKQRALPTLLWFIYTEKFNFIFWIFYSSGKTEWIPFQVVWSRKKGMWHIWDIVGGTVLSTWPT